MWITEIKRPPKKYVIRQQTSGHARIKKNENIFDIRDSVWPYILPKDR